MGIQDLLPILRTFLDVCEDVPLSKFIDKKGAVDISCVIYAYTYSASETILNLQKDLPPYNYHELNIYPKFIELFEIFLNLFKECKITPIFVFDGEKRPEKQDKINEKRKQTQKKYDKIKELENELIECTILDIDMKKVNKLRKMYSQVMRLTQKNKEQLKEYLESKNYSHCTAEYDAEELCCALCREGTVDFVYSTDSDTLVWGTPILLQKIDRKRKIFDLENYKNSPVCKIYHYDRTLEALNLTHEQFVDLCIMLKCDFNKRIPGVGKVTCIKLINEFGSIENLPEK